MKKSKTIQLLMLGGALSLTGCSGDYDSDDLRVKREVSQNQYASKEACMKDWGKDDEKECRSSNGVGGYSGPHYFYSHGSSPMIVNNDGTYRAAPNSYLAKPGTVSTSQSSVTSTATTISRGGFGATGHNVSSGG